jgi:hypothetical protein
MKRVTWINLIVGLWLIGSPYLLGYSDVSTTALTTAVVSGVLLVALSWWILAAMARSSVAGWLEVVCGFWLIAAPFILSYRTWPDAAINSIFAGGVVVLASALVLWSLWRVPVRA